MSVLYIILIVLLIALITFLTILLLFRIVYLIFTPKEESVCKNCRYRVKIGKGYGCFISEEDFEYLRRFNVKKRYCRYLTDIEHSATKRYLIKLKKIITK